VILIAFVLAGGIVPVYRQSPDDPVLSAGKVFPGRENWAAHAKGKGSEAVGISRFRCFVNPFSGINAVFSRDAGPAVQPVSADLFAVTRPDFLQHPA